MKWLRLPHQGVEGFGLIEGDRVAVHAGAMFESPRATGTTLALAELRWLPPCVPGKIVGLWNNFRAAAEKNGWAASAKPLYFLKSPGSVIGHGQAIDCRACTPGG